MKRVRHLVTIEDVEGGEYCLNLDEVRMMVQYPAIDDLPVRWLIVLGDSTGGPMIGADTQRGLMAYAKTHGLWQHDDLRPLPSL